MPLSILAGASTGVRRTSNDVGCKERREARLLEEKRIIRHSSKDLSLEDDSQTIESRWRSPTVEGVWISWYRIRRVTVFDHEPEKPRSLIAQRRAVPGMLKKGRGCHAGPLVRF